MNEETTDAEFTTSKHNVPVGDYTESKEIVDSKDMIIIKLTDASKKVGVHYQTIDNWLKKDGIEKHKAYTDWSSNPIRIIDINWLQKALDVRGRNIDWIKSKEYTVMKVKNGQILVDSDEKSQQTEIAVQPEGTTLPEFLESMAQVNLQVEDMKALIENSLNLKPEPLKKGNPKLYSVGGIIIVVLMVVSAGIIAYILVSQHKVAVTQRDDIHQRQQALTLKAHASEMSTLKKAAFDNERLHNSAEAKLKERHGEIITKKNKELQTSIAENKKLIKFITKNISSSKEEVQLEHLSDSGK